MNNNNSDAQSDFVQEVLKSWDNNYGVGDGIWIIVPEVNY